MIRRKIHDPLTDILHLIFDNNAWMTRNYVDARYFFVWLAVGFVCTESQVERDI